MHWEALPPAGTTSCGTSPPCRVTLEDGRIFDTVYIQPEMPYLRSWGVYPEDDRGKRFVKIEDVVKVEDSATRLPARFANQIYDHGESGMGYTIFTGSSPMERGKHVSPATQSISSSTRMERDPTTWRPCSPMRAGMPRRLELQTGIGASIQGSLFTRLAQRRKCPEGSARSRRLSQLRITSSGTTCTGEFSNAG